MSLPGESNGQGRPPDADLSERESVEEALPRGEEHFWAIINDSHAGYFFVDPQGCIRDCNEAYMRMLGYDSRADLIGRDLREVWADEEVPETQRFVERLLQHKRVESGEARHRRKDGSVGHCTFTAGPVVREDTVLGIEGFTIDVSERAEAEESLRKSWGQLRTILDAIPIPMLISRQSDGKIMHANSHVEAIFGMPVGSAVGRRTTELYADMKDREVLLAEVHKKGRARDVEVHVVKNDGTLFWVLASVEPTTFDGEPALMSSFYDITFRKMAEEALRRSEERYRFLIDHLPAGVVVHAPDTSIILSNAEAARLLGFSAGQMVGKTATDDGWHFVREDGSRLPVEDYPVNRVIATGQPLHECLIGGVVRPGSGERIWVLVEAFPEFDTQGRLQQVVVMFMDITKWRHDEQALIASERLFRTLAETVPAGITIVQDEVLRYVNPMVTRLMGYSTEEMIGKPPAHFVHPEMREEVIRRSAGREQGSEEATRFEMRILTKDGHELWVDQSVAVIEYEGKYATMGAALDVTHRKQMEAQLRETRERYQTLVENIELGITLVDKDYTVIMVNAAQGRMFGLSPDEITGRKCHRAFENHEAVCPHCPGTIAMQTGRPAEVDTEGVRPDGTRFSARVRAFPMSGPDGLATGFIEVVENITERMRAEQAIVASEAKYRTLVEQLPAIIYTTPPNAGPGTDYISPYVEKVLGHSPAEYTLNPNMWRDHIHPDDRERVLGDLEGSFAGGGPYMSEYRMIAHDGRIVWFRDEARLICDTDGTPLLLQGVMADITERKRAEEELRVGREKLAEVIEATHAGTWEWDMRTGAGVIDDRWAEIVGYTVEELRPVTRQTWLDLVHPDDTAKLDDVLRKHLAGELDYYVCEYRMRRKDGSRIWISARGRVVEWGADGKPLRMLGTHTDISARKRAEQAIVESEAKYRTLVERIPAIIYISPCQRPSATSYVNSCVERVLGYTPQEYEEKDLWRERLHPEDQDRVLAELSNSVAEGASFVSEYRIAARDGRIVWLHDEASIVRDAGGSPLFLQGVMLDITELKRTDAELRKFKAIADQTMLGNVIIDMEGRVCYVNKAQARMHGYAPEELIGKHVSIFHPPSVMPEVNRLIEMIKREGRSTGMQLWHQRRDGSVFPTLMDSTVISDEKGEPCFLAGIAADISELKRVETELRKFKTIADGTSHGQSIISLDGKILYANDAAARMHGYAPEELLGKDISVYHTPEQMAEVTRLLGRLKRDGRFANEEVWHVRRDGTVFPTLMDSVVTMDEEGRPLFLSGMMVDITERKHMEAALCRQALVFDNINDGVIVTDTQGRISDWNPGAERIFDYLKQEVVGEHPEMLNRSEEAKAITRLIQEGLARDGYWSGEVDFIRKDGTEGVCEVFVVPLRDDTQQAVGRIAVNRDITARKQAEEEKAQLEAQLHQAQKMEAVGTLAGGVAHDFNNLLTAIFGYTDLAKTSLPSEHAAIRSLEMVEQAGRQARGVINSLLTFSQKDILEKAPVDLAVSLVETVGLLRRLLPASIEIEEDMPTDREVWVNADPTQLQQVWMNLAVNARDAMGRGGRLRVSLDASAEAQQAGAIRPPAVVIVEDTGTGMSEEVKSRVFEPFFTTKPRGQGTGLGLSVTHAIVTNHGGRMEIESESGQGTRVKVFLPCCDPPPKAARAAPARRPAGRGESILVVEDDDQVRSILVSALRVQGYKVAVASDSAEAQLLLKRRHNILDLILMDLDLPKTSGTVLLRKIRRALPDVPILIVTGGAAGDAREEPERKQFLLRKPFQVSELVEEITKVLARSSRSRESR